MHFSCRLHFFFLLVAVAIIPCIHALKYEVINKVPSTTGGKLFTNQIGLNFAKGKMKDAVTLIRKIFKQDSVYDMKIVNTIKLIIDAEDMSSPYHIREEIHISAKFIANNMKRNEDHKKGRRIFCQVLYKLMTNVLQWDTKGIPEGLKQGIPQYVALKAGFFPTTKLKLNQGDRWDQGGEVTLQFLVYCNSLEEGFVGDLNEMMKSVYKESYFNKLLGKDVNVVWSQFKFKSMF